MQLSTIIGKPIVSPEGEDDGYVVGARLSRNYGKIVSLVCSDGDEEEYYLPVRAIRSVEDAVIAGKARLASPTGIPSPIGRTAYTSDGTYAGVVSDLLIFEDGAHLLLYRGAVMTTVPVGCAVVGERVVVYRDAESCAAARRRTARAHSKPVSQKRTVRRKAVPARERTDDVDKDENKDKEPAPYGGSAKEEQAGREEAEPIAAEELFREEESPKTEQNGLSREEESPTAEQCRTANEQNTGSVQLLRTNLLGKTVRRDVYDAFGSPIAVAGERITPRTLSLARRCNRLLHLAANTITSP